MLFAAPAPHDHAPDPATARARGPGRASVHRRTAQPVVGRRLHLRRHLDGICLCRVLCRCLLPGDHRMACLGIDDHRSGPRRPGDGDLAAPRQGTRSKDWSITPTPDRQYTSIRYTERLAEAGAKPSIGSVGDSYDNAMAESIIGLFKTELIRRQGPWRTLDDVEIATLEWVDWFNNRRLFEAIGHIPPAEAEATTTAHNSHLKPFRWQNKPSTEPGAVQPGVSHRRLTSS